jgi:glycosyltransferase involved in cell wall biosynthesis
MRMSSIRAAAPKGQGPVVLQVLPSLEPGGSARSAIDTARAVAEAGGVSLVASAGGPLARDLLRAGARLIELPLASRNPFPLRRAARRLARIIRAQGVDIVHARGPGASWSAWRASGDARAHFLSTFDTVYERSGALQRRYTAAMAKGERVIAVSQFLADHIRDSYPVEPGRIRLIRRGIDLSYFDPDQVRPERMVQLARRWSLPDGVPVIMAASRRGWSSNGVLLEALAQITHLPFRCLLVGAGEEEPIQRRELERLLGRLGLSERVQLTGDCGDMPAAYMLADVVVTASSEPEAFVHVVTEAQAMGRPVVATNHGGVEEQVVRGRTAWLAPPGDPEALAAAIAEALALTPEQRFALGQIAQAHARESFGKERMCAQTLAVYRELLRADAYALGPAAA